MPQFRLSAGILATFAGLAIVLDIPLLMLHGRHQNTAAMLLVAWTIVMNFFNFFNPIIWHTANTKSAFSGLGYCDINIRMTIGGSVGLSVALLCLFQTLAGVLDTDRGLVLPSRARTQRRKLRDLALCVVLPVVFMTLHYLAEPSRFSVYPVAGCYPMESSTWVGIAVYFIWPLVFLLAASFYCTLVAIRCVRYKLEFGRVLSESSRNRSSRFVRLLVMAIFILVLCLPLEIVVFYYALARLLPLIPYSFQVTHKHWNQPYYSNSYQPMAIFSMSISIFIGLSLFMFFGFTRDMKGLLRRSLCAVGINRLVPISLQTNSLMSLSADRRALMSGAAHAQGVSGHRAILRTTEVTQNSFGMESFDLCNTKDDRSETSARMVTPHSLIDPPLATDVEIQGGKYSRLDPF